MKDTIIRCRNGKEADLVLQRIEDRFPEVRWNSGCKPTKFKPSICEYEGGCCYFVVTNNIFGKSLLSYKTQMDIEMFANDCKIFANAMSAKRFLRKTNTTIRIYQIGRKVIAHESNTGREGVATCCPTDEFDFTIGARIALLRLWKKEVPEELFCRRENDSNAIHEGDMVRVVDTGGNYPEYANWIAKNIDSVEEAARFVYGGRPFIGCKYTVLKLAEHERNGKMLAYIRRWSDTTKNTECHIVSVDCLEKVNDER